MSMFSHMQCRQTLQTEPACSAANMRLSAFVSPPFIRSSHSRMRRAEGTRISWKRYTCSNVLALRSLEFLDSRCSEANVK